MPTIALLHVEVQPLQDVNILAGAAVGFSQAAHLNQAV
jgi:hypothetical protein